jgi:hypothetical protein
MINQCYSYGVTHKRNTITKVKPEIDFSKSNFTILYNYISDIEKAIRML